MESTKQTVMYYIKGVPGRGKEVIQTLEDKGGSNASNLEGNQPKCVYYISYGYIKEIPDTNKMVINMLREYGTELMLPEKPEVRTFNDLDVVSGFYVENGDIRLVQRIERSNRDVNMSDVFADGYTARAVIAAARITQVRGNTKLYGDYNLFKMKKQPAWIICSNKDYKTVIEKSDELGGLLRFDTEEHAKTIL